MFTFLSEKQHRPSGSVLVEILIATALISSLMLMLGQVAVTAFASAKISGERITMLGLAQEGIEAARVINTSSIEAKREYYLYLDSGRWRLSTDKKFRTIFMNSRSYDRALSFDENNLVTVTVRSFNLPEVRLETLVSQ